MYLSLLIIILILIHLFYLSGEHLKTYRNLESGLETHCIWQTPYLLLLPRSCRWEMFCEKGIPRNFAKFIRKHLCQRLFFKKVAGLMPATLLKKSLCHWCFSVNFAKFQRTYFLQNTSGSCFCTCFNFLIS